MQEERRRGNSVGPTVVASMGRVTTVQRATVFAKMVKAKNTEPALFLASPHSAYVTGTVDEFSQYICLE